MAISGALIDYLFEKDRTALVMALQDGDEFLKDEILEYLLEKQVCPDCFCNLNVVYEKNLVTRDPYPLYENMSVGYQCINSNCNYKYYFGN